MKTTMHSTLLATAAILVLLGGSTAAFANIQQQLNLTVPEGGVTQLGNQTYTVSGGQVVEAVVDGQLLTTAYLQFNYVAQQSGVSTSGYGTIRLTGTISGEKVTVSGNFGIDSAMALTSIGGTELPGFFVSSSPNIYVTMGGSTQALGQPFALESPYLNPFGNPIVLTSADGYSVVIVTTYNVGTIYWQGTQLMGAMTGTLGSTAASGTFMTTGNEFEDLVAGTAQDQGTISFTGMTPTSLNVDGTYQGSDYIPSAGAVDCSSYTGLPGTCTETGFQSSGTFFAQGISGSYQTEWSVPALAFYTTIQATVPQAGTTGQHNGHGGLGNGFFGLLGLLGFLEHI